MNLLKLVALLAMLERKISEETRRLVTLKSMPARRAISAATRAAVIDELARRTNASGLREQLVGSM
jgi:hypothetical protein